MASLNGRVDVIPEQAKLATQSTPPSASLRQSPPLVTDIRAIPSGAIMSPPESPSGSDDESKPNNSEASLRNLREAVSHMSHGTPPSSDENLAQEAPQELLVKSPLQISFGTSSLSHDPVSSGRRVSHVRSATEPDASLTTSAENSITISSESKEDLYSKALI